MSNPFSGGSPRSAGIMPRRPSYASVVSGPAASGISPASNQPARSGAFSSMLNGSEFDYNSYYPPTSHSPNNPSSGEFYSSRTGGINMAGGHGSYGSWGTLPSFSRAFGLFTNGYGSTNESRNDQFFIPSYLHGSPHVKRLAEAHKAKQASRDATNSSSQPGSLSTSASSVNIHAKAPSHRGMTYDLIEKAPPIEDGSLPPLPSRWSQTDKHSALEVMGDGLEVKLVGPKSLSERDHEACTIRADHYIPPQVGLYYFEVTIMSRKREEYVSLDGIRVGSNKHNRSSIGIGFSAKGVSLSRVPGWEPDSWAYHGDDGHSFCSSQSGKAYGPKFSVGDVVGCGIDYQLGQAFFTRNGDHLGTAFREIKGKLFPTVGMKKAGEQVRINFGQSPFIFDIDGLMEERQLQIREQIEQTSTAKLAPPLSETQLIQKLVLQFLTHDGYVETARAFAAEVNEEESALNIDPNQAAISHDVKEDEDAVHRQRIRTAILEGDIDKALKHTNVFYPNVLSKNENIYFQLRCRKFIEMIRLGAEMSSAQRSSPPPNPIPSNNENDWYDSEMELDDDRPPVQPQRTNGSAATQDYSSLSYQKLLNDTLAYGQELQAEFQSDPRREVKKALDSAFALLAYPDPFSAKGVGHLLDKSGRATLAEELNSAILVSLGKSSTAALEQVYQQTTVLLQDLRDTSDMLAHFVDVDACIQCEGVMWNAEEREWKNSGS